MFAFILWLFIFLTLFTVLTNPYKSYYPTSMYFGKKGSGKTTLLTKRALKDLKRGKVVYTTVEVPGCILLNPKRLADYNLQANSALHVDEVGTVWDKRDFANFDKNIRDFFKYARHQRVTVSLYSQSWEDVDLKIRACTDSLYIIKKYLRVFTVARRIDKIQDIGHNSDGNGTIIDDYRYCSIFDCLLGGGLVITFIPRWTNYFDSFSQLNRPTYNATPLPLTPLQVEELNTFTWLKNRFKSLLNGVRGFAVYHLEVLSNSNGRRGDCGEHFLKKITLKLKLTVQRVKSTLSKYRKKSDSVKWRRL